LIHLPHRRTPSASAAVRERLIAFFKMRQAVNVSSATSRTFDVLADLWERETRNLSSVTAITSHPAYQTIIRMGRDVLPLILRRMQQRPALWFDALHRISGEDPVKPQMFGNVQRMTDTWVKWGAERGLI
jgi:hypothetical protein